MLFFYVIDLLSLLFIIVINISRNHNIYATCCLFFDIITLVLF